MTRFIPLAIILLAFALRFQNLTYHSLWFDEAVSVHWARQSIPRILEVGFTLQEDRLPPLYYLLLKGWSYGVGDSEFGLRSLSGFMGVLLVPVMLGLTQRLYRHRPLAWLTGLLVALNPFLIWYSQEVRMYAQAVLFATLSINYQLSIIHYPPKKEAFKSQFFLLNFQFILFATAALYSHLYAAFLLPALGVWLLISYPRHLPAFILNGLIITLAYSPILRAIWQFSAEATPGDPFTGVMGRAGWLLQAFTLWQARLESPWPLVIPLSVGLWALLGSLKFKAHSTPIKNPTLLVILLTISPFMIANLLLFRNYLAFFGERYFIIIVPWLLLLVAKGQFQLINYKFRPLYFFPFIAYLSWLTFFTLPGQWSPAAAKEAWRHSVAYLAQHATPQDAILIHPDWVRYPFQYYFQGPGQTYAAFSNITPSTDLDGPLQGVVGHHAVIWLIQSHQEAPDPQRLVEQWLANRYPLVTELYPPGIALKGYAAGYHLTELPTTATPAHHVYTNGLTLVGYQADQQVKATDDLFHPPSGWVHVTLYWAATPPLTNTLPVVELVGAAGVWGLSLDRATDALKLYPPTRWTPGQIIRQDLDVNLNPATPPGRYSLVLRVGAETTPLSHVEVY